VREQVGIGLIAKRVLASPVYRQFAAGAPGLKEMAVLGHALRLVRGTTGDGSPDIDAVVIDAPATGHGLSLLAAPRLVSEVITEGPFGTMSAELAAWTGDPALSAVVLAALAEEMPAQEAIEMIAGLGERLSRRPDLLVVNGLYPAPDAPPEPGEPPELALWRRRRQVNDRELARLALAWDGPRAELPLLPLDRGPRLIAALERHLAEALEEAA